ncbi:MAG: hypothetical protein R3C17_20875 [Planctomycetaceae bacterium]
MPLKPQMMLATSPKPVSLIRHSYLDLAAGTYFVAVVGAGGSTGSDELRTLADSTYAATVPVFDSLIDRRHIVFGFQWPFSDG